MSIFGGVDETNTAEEKEVDRRKAASPETGALIDQQLKKKPPQEEGRRGKERRWIRMRTK